MSEDMFDPVARKRRHVLNHRQTTKITSNVIQESPDQLTHERGVCMTKNCDVRKYFLVLRECQKRIESKEYTAETCHQETVDLVEAIDRCVADKAFVKFR